MIPNIVQSIEDIIKNSTPEEKILWQQVRLILGENCSVRQINYQGPINGTDFITYSATKLFLATRVNFSYSSGTGPAFPQIAFYDQLNALSGAYSYTTTYWDATAAAARYTPSAQDLKNIWFSRIASTVYDYMMFTGYKLGG